MTTVKQKNVAAKSVKAATAVPTKSIQTPAASTTLPKFSSNVAARPVLMAETKPVIKATTKAKAEKPAKVKKSKLVRDSFTIPKVEYSVLDELKQRAGKLTRPVKKSELLRAGIKALAAMSDAAFLATLKAVPAIKTGRPSKN